MDLAAVLYRVFRRRGDYLLPGVYIDSFCDFLHVLFADAVALQEAVGNCLRERSCFCAALLVDPGELGTSGADAGRVASQDQ